MSSDFEGAIADNLHHTKSPPRVDHYYDYYTSIYVCIYTYSFYHAPYPGTMTVYFKVLSSQCYYRSMYYYCSSCCIPAIHVFVPKLCRPIIHQDKHDRLSKQQHLLSSRTALKIYKYSNYWNACPPRAVTNFVVDVFFIWCISPCGPPTTLLYSGKQGIDIFSAPSRDTKYLVLYNDTGTQSITSQLLFWY